MYFCGGHYRQPVEFDDERLAEAAARVRADPGGRAGGSSAGARARPGRRRCGSASSTRWPSDFNTPRALAAVFEWVREANAPGAARSATPTCARCSTCWGWRTCSSVDAPQAPAEALELSRAARARPRRARLRGRPTGCATSCETLGWEVRDGPGRPELLRSARAVIVYGRNPVREAIRGPRAVMRVWATKNARARAVAGRRRAPVADRGRAPRRSSAAAAPRRTRACAPRSAPFRYADADAAAAPLPEPLIVALDQVQDPQNLGAICRTAECAGATGVVLPERRSAEVTPAVCKASAGAVEHLPVARVRNLADFLADAKAAGLWCYGADADGRRRLRRRRLLGRRRCWCSAPRGGGCARAWRRPATRWSRCRCAGRIESLSVSAAAAVLLYAAARGAAAERTRPACLTRVQCYVKLAPGDKDQLEL